MSLKICLEQLNLDKTAKVTFTYENAADVFHFNETHIDTALAETDVVDRLADVVTSGLPVTTEHGGHLLQVLRDAELLDDYKRGTHTFKEYVARTIRENFYDSDLIEARTEKYDHKRGRTILTAKVLASLDDIVKYDKKYTAMFQGWEAKVSTGTGVGTLVISI